MFALQMTDNSLNCWLQIVKFLAPAAPSHLQMSLMSYRFSTCTTRTVSARCKWLEWRQKRCWLRAAVIALTCGVTCWVHDCFALWGLHPDQQPLRRMQVCVQCKPSTQVANEATTVTLPRYYRVSSMHSLWHAYVLQDFLQNGWLHDSGKEFELFHRMPSNYPGKEVNMSNKTHMSQGDHIPCFCDSPKQK